MKKLILRRIGQIGMFTFIILGLGSMDNHDYYAMCWWFFGAVLFWGMWVDNRKEDRYAKNG